MSQHKLDKFGKEVDIRESLVAIKKKISSDDMFQSHHFMSPQIWPEYFNQ